MTVTPKLRVKNASPIARVKITPAVDIFSFPSKFSAHSNAATDNRAYNISE